MCCYRLSTQLAGWTSRTIRMTKIFSAHLKRRQCDRLSIACIRVWWYVVRLGMSCRQTHTHESGKMVWQSFQTHLGSMQMSLVTLRCFLQWKCLEVFPLHLWQWTEQDSVSVLLSRRIHHFCRWYTPAKLLNLRRNRKHWITTLLTYWHGRCWREISSYLA